MKIHNQFLRAVVSYAAATFKFSMDNVGKAELQSRIKTKVCKRYADVKSPFLTIRLLNPDIVVEQGVLQLRDPVFIKDLVVKPNTWTKGEYFIEEHDASHLHHDVSIVVNGKVYRMARTPALTNQKSGFLGILPGPGEKSQFVLQPEHLVKEVPNPSVITEGYGKGTTKVVKTGFCYVNVSSNGNLHAVFEDIDGVYVFIEKDKSVLITRKMNEPMGFGKHVMRDDRNIDAYINNPDFWFCEKLDGSAIEWQIVDKGGRKHLVVHSYRPDAKLRKKYHIETQIDHTYRIKIADALLPDDIPLAKGRGEAWIKGSDGPSKVTSLLNSGVAKARDLPYSPEIYIHDLLEWEGKDVSKLSYREKLNLMEQLNEKDKRLQVPNCATTPTTKRNMWDRNRNRQDIDGVVAWPVNESGSSLKGRATKLKYKHDQDNWYPATIVDIVPQKGEHNEKYGYPILENQWGVHFKSSGLGLDETTKADMLANPDKWIGQPVRYSAERHFETTHLPFQPVLKSFSE